jgi:rod shape-determining protein MreC
VNRKLKVILGLLFFSYFAVYLFSLTFTKNTQTKFHEKAIVKVAAPLQYILTFSYDKISSVFSHYFYLVGASKENDRLLLENGELKQKVILLEELKLENERLRVQMELTTPPRYNAINAERIATSGDKFEKTIRINKGGDDHVAVRMPVINFQGVVGQVVEVFGGYSIVLLLADKSNGIDVIIQRTRSRGVLKGFSQHQMTFEFLSADEDLLVGDVVISSGLDGVYPAGMPVGVVSAVGNQGRRLFLSATVDPYVDFSRIEEVQVLSKKE